MIENEWNWIATYPLISCVFIFDELCGDYFKYVEDVY